MENRRTSDAAQFASLLKDADLKKPDSAALFLTRLIKIIEQDQLEMAFNQLKLTQTSDARIQEIEQVIKQHTNDPAFGVAQVALAKFLKKLKSLESARSAAKQFSNALSNCPESNGSLSPRTTTKHAELLGLVSNLFKNDHLQFVDVIHDEIMKSNNINENSLPTITAIMDKAKIDLNISGTLIDGLLANIKSIIAADKTLLPEIPQTMKEGSFWQVRRKMSASSPDKSIRLGNSPK